MKKTDFYIQEAIAQAEYALMAHGEYEKAMSAADTNLVFYHLHHFVLHVTNIDKLLFPKENNFRLKILKGIQEKIRIEISSIRRLRNHLEHFDDRLDRYWSSVFRLQHRHRMQRVPRKRFLAGNRQKHL